ncbi:hypothetical protein D3C87_2013840 [compost metagenome]
MRNDQGRHHEEIDDVLSIHKKDLASLGLIQLVADPVASSFGDLTTCDDERMVDQDSSTEL